MRDSVTIEILKDLLNSGRLVSAGSLTLDGEVISKAPESKETPDKHGFYAPETDFGGQQNEKINKIRKEWQNSSDPLKQSAVKKIPHLFAAFSEHYNPKRGSDDYNRMWYNNNRYYFTSGGDWRLFVLLDKTGNEIEDHLFVALGACTWLDSSCHDEYMSRLPTYYLRLLESQYSNEMLSQDRRK